MVFFGGLSLCFSVKEKKKRTAKHEKKPFNVSFFFRKALWKVFWREDWKMKCLFQGEFVCHVSFQRRKKITLPETNSLPPQKQWLEDDVS